MDKGRLIQIPYFMIGNTPGGNQEWFHDRWMNLGGCAALAACDLCICLAKNYQVQEALPFPVEALSRESYEKLGMIMKPYIRPRVMGVTKLYIFTEGCGRYLADRGLTASFDTCDGRETYPEAASFIKKALKNALPVSFLLLSHRDRRMKDLNWHWFSVTGYREENEMLSLIYHTYGEKLEVNFRDLWHTGAFPKGGIVALRSLKRNGKELL